MMRNLKLCALLCVITALSACAGVAKRNAGLYQTARDADIEQTKAESMADSNATAARATAFAALAAKCSPADTACVVSLADKLVLSDAIAALKAAARPAQSQTRVPYERDLAAKSRDLLAGATPLASIIGNTWLGGKQSDNARDIALGDQASQRAIVESVAELGEQPTTELNAGGNINTGSTNEVNTTVGRDLAGRDHTEANPTTTAGRDMAGRDQFMGPVTTGAGNAVNESQIGDRAGRDLRPITRTGNECTGTECQSIRPPPEPIDPGT